MKMNGLQVLARVLDLLASSGTSELEAAVEIAGFSPELQEALRLLADARKKLGGSSGRARSAPKHRAGRESPVQPTRGRDQRSVVREKHGERISRLVSDRQEFPTNKGIAENLNGLGLDVKFRPKDSRQDMAEKLINSLARLSLAKRREALATVYRLLPRTETEGWFKAIRGEK